MDFAKKFRELSGEIDRLGQYLGEYSGTRAIKRKGKLYLYGTTDLEPYLIVVPRKLECFLNGDDGEPTPLGLEAAVARLTIFGGTILRAATMKARGEVIEELVQRKLKRITRAKTRGFKADLVKGKKTKKVKD